MEINVLPLGDIGANCYMIKTQNAAIVIDAGFESEYVTDFLLSNQDKERMILLTHCHFDHIGGANDLREKTNTKIGIGEYDAEGLFDNKINLSYNFMSPIKPFKADVLFENNQTFSVGDLEFTVLHTPGHTKGGVCYLFGDVLFSGDTLFEGSIGRTDFPGGSFKTLENSVKQLYTLNEETVVLSGHGQSTTIKNEKLFNPFIRG